MRLAKLCLAVLIVAPSVALAQGRSQQPESQQPEAQQPESTAGQSTLAEGQSSSNCMGHIVFSQEFLSRYPNAGGACREVKMEHGQKWARFDADVVNVKGNRITATFVDRFDRHLGTITFDAHRDARVLVRGRRQRFSTLRPGDILAFWMREDQVGFYAAPAASESSRLAVVSTSPMMRR